jgi:AcrR family transcriptional regulator
MPRLMLLTSGNYQYQNTGSMSPRLTRDEQGERNRQLVLDAARRVFLARGYNGASLEAIADAAGFSKGVVYSQFESKADLFLALLDRRIAERAELHERFVAELAGADGFAALLALSERMVAAEPDWALLVIEFRVHAARDPVLSDRYAAAHARSLDGLERTIAHLYEAAGMAPSLPMRTVAEFAFACSTGLALEHAANPVAIPVADATAMVVRAVGLDVAAATRSTA